MTGEVVISKEEQERTVKVRDSVRQTEVDVDEDLESELESGAGRYTGYTGIERRKDRLAAEQYQGTDRRSASHAY